MNTLPRENDQISRSDAWPVSSYISLDAARAMRDYAARVGAGLPKYLLAPEVAALLSYIDDLARRAYFDTLWNTGARLNEALALTPGDFELEPTRRQPHPAVTLRTLKQRTREASRGRGRPPANTGPARRIVPLLDAAYVQRMREFLATTMKRVKHREIWSVTSRQTPVNWLSEALARAESDGVTFPIPVTPHTFRHSFAMHLKLSGMPDPVLQSLLGHRYARSTEIYSRVFAPDVLAGRGLSFSLDGIAARDLLR